MKKLLYVLLAVTLMFAATACGDSKVAESAEKDSGSTAPLTSAEATQEKISEDFGFEMAAPENAEDAKWAVIDECIAQLTFKLDGQNVCFRMTTDEVPSAEDEALQMLRTVSETNEEFAESETGKAGECDAFVFFNSGKSGAVIWYSEDGIICTATVDRSASADGLLELAETLDSSAE